MLRNLLAYTGLSIAMAVSGIGPSYAAAPYPTKNIMVVVPFPAGGRSDITIRVIAPHLERSLGQSLVILNRPGGGSSIGSRTLAQARADGYTIGFTTNAIVSTQYTVKDGLNLGHFTPICLVNTDPAVMAVAASAQWKDLPSLIRYARENPKKLLIGINPGASAHLFAAAFAKAAGIDAMLIPYKGGPDRVAALMGGHIHADFGVLAQYRSMLNAKRVRILGVASASRNPGYSDVPTFRESGVDLEISGWQGFFAPRGIPADIRARLDTAIRAALNDPDVLQQLAKIDVQVTYLPPDKFGAFLKKEDASTRDLIRDLGLMVTDAK